MGVDETVAKIAEEAQQDVQAYEGDSERPLRALAGLIATYLALVAALGLLVRRRGGLPEQMSARDLALAAVATHKIGRLVAKDPVGSPLRAPFTRYAGRQAPAELHEEVRGRGLREALGELITCPFCVDQWVATLLVFGLTLAPRATRLVASVFVTVTGADVLQYAYAELQQRIEG